MLPPSCQVTYGVLPENVMSGWSASTPELSVASGSPLFAILNCPLTNRETKIRSCPPVVSCQATHGTVAPPTAIVPPATRGSTASAFASAFNEHPASLDPLTAQVLPVAVSSSTPWPVPPTA